MRQPLKRLDEVFSADRRHSYFVAPGGAQVSFEQHYLRIAEIKLTDEAPEQIWEQFETVRNLHLYSWYVYDFTVPAGLYAKSLVEKALKFKCKAAGCDLDELKGLRRLLDYAIEEGWLRNRHFPYAMEWGREELVSSGDGQLLRQWKARYQPDGIDYVQLIATTLPKLRNFDMHGDAGLFTPGQALDDLEMCACIINALFPELEIASDR